MRTGNQTRDPHPGKLVDRRNGTELRRVWTNTAGGVMHARVGGDPHSGRPVVLVHGMIISGRYMVPTAVELAPLCAVYAVDLPGYGDSVKPRAILGLRQLADALAGWMDAMRFPAAHLVANSFGCQVLAEFALHHAERVDRLVFQGPTVDPNARSVSQQLARLLRNSSSEASGLGWITFVDYVKAGMRRIRATIRMAIEDRIEAKLPGITAPTLVVRGGKDPLVPQAWAEEVVRRLPRGELRVLLGLGHTINYTAPKEFVNTLRPFLHLRAAEWLTKSPTLLTSIPLPGMLRALAASLRGEGLPLLGAMHRSRAPLMKLVAAAVNHLSTALQEQVYIWSGWLEATPSRKLDAVSGDEVATWMTDLYPRRQYPAVAVGSSNGAAVHLWSALGIPWLPQTFLVPVARSGIPPDEPREEMRWAEPHAELVLGKNPDLELHHMQDPVQDRLMVKRMSYFRLKRRTLGPAYERFLRECLEPGGTIVVVECGLQWPTIRRGDRYTFQFGALGGATAEEMMHGGTRVEAYLRQHGSLKTRWEPREADGTSPEAEWGFAPSLRDDVLRFAQRHGYRVRRVVFEQPEDMSPLVADLYRWWYQRLGVTDNRLVVDSFILMEPYWTSRTRSVPFWMVFNTEGSFHALEEYLGRVPAFDELLITLFSHGVDSIGLVPIEQWRRLFSRARKRGDFIGVDEASFPRDFAVFVRYHFDFLHKIRSRYPSPPALTLTELNEFLNQAGEKYRVAWLG